jgi:DNA-binding NarL/FixJ family response regulator
MDKNKRQIRVLLVDDQSIIRKGLEMQLSIEEDIIIVGEAGDGKQALEASSELRPEVVIMDYAMPVMDGLQATTVLKERYPEIAVIILSIEDSSILQTQAFQAGASGFVSKREGTDRLITEIRRAVKG